MSEDNGFNPTEHLTDIRGKDYLEVKWRLVWFRSEHSDWTIQTEIVERVKGGAIMRAEIKNDKGIVMATAHKMETRKGFPDFLEKAETGAVGRALAMVGYGTQFAPELEEGTERIVDAPVGSKQGERADDYDGEWKKKEATRGQIKAIYGIIADQFNLSKTREQKMKFEELMDVDLGGSFKNLTRGVASSFIEQYGDEEKLGNNKKEEEAFDEIPF